MDIVIRKLSKNFGSKRVLSDFSAVLPAYQVTVITGPSGCGKTTLLNILMGLVTPDAGEVYGVPKLKSAVFQEDRLCESFNAISNVRFVCDKRVSDHEIVSHLERVGLRGSLRQPVHELSGGMKRRVAIVRGVLATSDILFLDEPFRGLDDETKESTMQYVRENINGRTVIMVTHNLDEARLLNGQVIRMKGPNEESK